MWDINIIGLKHLQSHLESLRKEKESFEDQRTTLFGRARSLHEEIVKLKEKVIHDDFLVVFDGKLSLF